MSYLVPHPNRFAGAGKVALIDSQVSSRTFKVAAADVVDERNQRVPLILTDRDGDIFCNRIVSSLQVFVQPLLRLKQRANISHLDALSVAETNRRYTVAVFIGHR